MSPHWPDEYWQDKPKKKREKGVWDLAWRVCLIPIALGLIVWAIILLGGWK